MCTYTQGGWGTECKGNNPGCVRDANFANDFPSGLFIGGAKAGALWTTSPTSTAAGVLAGQQVAAKLNLGILDAPTSYVFVGCVARKLIGVSVGDVIAMADEAMSSGSPPSGLSFSDLSDALATFNENYDECRDEGCLAPSLREAPQPTPGRKPVGTTRRPSLPVR